MVGLHRLDNLQDCVTEVLRRGVPGDLIETGVWRGGVTIFMRAILKAYGDVERDVWVADSFQGLPKPDPSRWPADADDELWTLTWVPTSLEVVQANFARYGLLDEQVRFLPGWFSDTLPTAPIERLAVLRLDGDMYGSTMEALEALYPKLSVGGYVIVDDYGAFAQCKEAVTDFRAANGIMDPMEWVDESCVFWQRS
jgi:O-methyltransferase